jgi:DNA-binding NarL/FixJ family response regulator
MPISVLLAEDNDLMRSAIRHLLKGDADIHIVAETASFAEMIALVRQLKPEVVVMDLHMRDEYRVRPHEIKASWGECRLVAISFANDRETRALARSFGADILLDKMNLTTELIPAIKRPIEELPN